MGERSWLGGGRAVTHVTNSKHSALTNWIYNREDQTFVHLSFFQAFNCFQAFSGDHLPNWMYEINPMGFLQNILSGL